MERDFQKMATALVVSAQRQTVPSARQLFNKPVTNEKLPTVLPTNTQDI